MGLRINYRQNDVDDRQWRTRCTITIYFFIGNGDENVFTEINQYCFANAMHWSVK